MYKTQRYSFTPAESCRNQTWFSLRLLCRINHCTRASSLGLDHSPSSIKIELMQINFDVVSLTLRMSEHQSASLWTTALDKPIDIHPDQCKLLRLRNKVNAICSASVIFPVWWLLFYFVKLLSTRLSWQSKNKSLAVYLSWLPKSR